MTERVAERAIWLVTEAIAENSELSLGALA